MRAIDADAMIDRLKEWDTKDKTDKALYNFTLNRINEQPTIQPEPHWISCKEKLPEYGVDCIVTVKQKYPWQTDWEYFIDLGWRGDYIDGAWDTTNDWDEGQETHISAWMPLPPVYQGE